MGSRYDRGTADYVNCPMTEAEYDAFWQALTAAEEAPVHGFEDKQVLRAVCRWKSWPAGATTPSATAP